MDYLIDGHNLIGAMPDISLADPDDEDQLIERLKGYMGRKRNRCTVVFDNGMLGGLSPELSSSRIKVYFAPNRTEADAIIRSRIRKAENPRNLLVISSDREIIAEARRWGAETMSSKKFASKLAPQQHKPGGDAGEKPVPSPDDVRDIEDQFLRGADGKEKD